MSYKLTRKAEGDLAALIDFSLERFGLDTALRHLEKLERSIEALDRGDFEGPEITIAARERPVRRWPIPPHWDLLRPRRRRAARAPHLPRGARTALTSREGSVRRVNP